MLGEEVRKEDSGNSKYCEEGIKEEKKGRRKEGMIGGIKEGRIEGRKE